MALNPSRDSNGYEGMAALGVLKADVDHLGLLMACGLKNSDSRFRDLPLKAGS